MNAFIDDTLAITTGTFDKLQELLEGFLHSSKSVMVDMSLASSLNKIKKFTRNSLVW